METIFNEAVARVGLGARFKVDFPGRTLKLNGKPVIDHGKYEGDSGLPAEWTGDVLGTIESLYARYKHSVPSERSESKRTCYFRALPEHELEDDDMLYGENRNVAQIRLELFILLCIIEGKLVWDEQKMGKWFWQSPADKDLVILRNWIENQPTQ